MARVTPVRWLSAVLLLCSAAPAWSQSVHVVAGDGSGDFTQLQAAVDAAVSGDVILVRPQPARYGHTTIAGKSLTLVGDGAQRPLLEDLRVVDLAADEVVSLRFLDIEGRSQQTPFGATQAVGIELSDDAGCVWLQDLLVSGAAGKPKLGGSEAGLAGMSVDSCACVVLVGCEVRGGDGAWSVGGSTYPGGTGLRQVGGRTALYGSLVAGGAGSQESLLPAAPGGAGLLGSGAQLHASGTSLVGGDTGASFGLPTQVPTATGLGALAGTSVQIVASTTAAGGGPAPPGAPQLVVGLSSVTDLADSHRAIQLPPAVRELETVALTYAGQPGDLVVLRVSASNDWTLAPDLKGVQQLELPTVDLLLGVADGSGALTLPVVVPRLPPGVDASVGYAQPLARALGGGLRLGAPSQLLILDESFPLL